MKLQQNIARATLSLTVLTCSATAHAQTLLRTVNGPAASAQFGKACISIPDQNGDGLSDLLVGAPGYNSQAGAVFCISGAFPATGAGTPLWSSVMSPGSNGQYGASIANVGDLTGDGHADYLIGVPGYDVIPASDIGAVALLNGSSHVIISYILGGITSTNWGPGALFGSAIAACGDINGDGITEVVIGAPGSAQSYVRVVNGASLTATSSSIAGELMMWSGSGYGGNGALGTAIVSGFDLDGDGFQEFAMSLPGWDGGGTDSGAIEIREVSSGFPSVGFYLSTISSERLGQSLDAAHDYDGDGVVDIVVGAPNSPNGTAFEVGRAVVLSGSRIVAQTPPYEIYTYTAGSPAPPVNHSDPDPDFHFGAAVRACADLNNDGVGEIMVGAPGFVSQGLTTGWSFRGLVRVFSGATGMQLCSITGGTTDHLGDGLAGAIDDLDGDGFREFVLAGSLSDAGGTDSGVLKCYRFFPIAPSTYCVGKVNSLGCIPGIGFSGTASASSSSPCLITAAGEINQKNGLMFYGHAPTSVPFQGGTMCVASPTSRTAIQNSGGSTSGADCSGSFSFDFNAHIQSGLDPTLVAGAEVFAQYWARDPASPSTTSLSTALRLLIHP